jgi:hypothetical protein
MKNGFVEKTWQKLLLFDCKRVIISTDKTHLQQNQCGKVTGGKAETTRRSKMVAIGDFGEVLLEITDEAFEGLSKMGKKVVYAHLRKQYGLTT